jgi:SAM-dependent methyltransferase
MFAGLAQRLVDSAALTPGLKVLDVGCGAGGLFGLIAERIGPNGSLTGVDVSAPLLDVAAARARQLQLASARCLEADAGVVDLGSACFDVAISRLGVMFFSDPAAGLANIRRVIKPGGRFVFACWRPAKQNQWVTTPYRAIADLMPEQPPMDPYAPGPFAFADWDRTEGLLHHAGFSSVSVTALDVPLMMASAGGAQVAADMVMQVGPTSRALTEAGPQVMAEARARLVQVLQPHERDGVVSLVGALWLAHARVAA